MTRWATARRVCRPDNAVNSEIIVAPQKCFGGSGTSPHQIAASHLSSEVRLSRTKEEAPTVTYLNAVAVRLHTEQCRFRTTSFPGRSRLD
jgi:hypothetical protein